jgi:hypothetical protein
VAGTVNAAVTQRARTAIKNRSGVRILAIPTFSFFSAAAAGVVSGASHPAAACGL